jgi:membrane protease YdiL (CAAX protease family)
VLSHLEAIDREYLDPKRTSTGRLLIVMYVSGLVLWLLNYMVLDGDYQRWMGDFLVHDLGLFGGGEEGAADNGLLGLSLRVSWSLGCVALYMVVPILVTLVLLRRPLSFLGLSPKGYARHFWIYGLLFLPVAGCVWVVSYQEAFLETYPFYHKPDTWGHFLLWELFYGLQFLSLEVFFRGFMLSELKHQWGWKSVLFMVVPYCMIHFTKPCLEALGALIAGTVLGFLALRTRSIWGGVTIHVAVAWSMDVTSLAQRGILDRLTWL